MKLSVASLVTPGGLLVLNADDPLLRFKAGGLAQRFGHRPRLGWFALDADSPALRAHRDEGGATCGVRDGRLKLSQQDGEHDLGPVAEMPLTVDGSAAYNVSNLAAAALAAAAIGVAPEAIKAVFAEFGSDPDDNKGRLMRFDVGGVTVLVDYAHNPEGIRGLIVGGGAPPARGRAARDAVRARWESTGFRPAACRKGSCSVWARLRHHRGTRGLPARSATGRGAAHHPRGITATGASTSLDRGLHQRGRGRAPCPGLGPSGRCACADGSFGRCKGRNTGNARRRPTSTRAVGRELTRGSRRSRPLSRTIPCDRRAAGSCFRCSSCAG